MLIDLSLNQRERFLCLFRLLIRGNSFGKNILMAALLIFIPVRSTNLWRANGHNRQSYSMHLYAFIYDLNHRSVWGGVPLSDWSITKLTHVYWRFISVKSKIKTETEIVGGEFVSLDKLIIRIPSTDPKESGEDIESSNMTGIESSHLLSASRYGAKILLSEISL